jgi:hypothetical protein
VTKSRNTRQAGKSRATGTRSAAARANTKPAARKKTKPAAAPAQRTAATTSEQPACEDEAAFTEALIASGEAARLDEHGKLPAGATHKIVEDEQGNVKVVRRRFSMS